GDAVDEGAEKYGLNWPGKRRARQLALTPSIGTLRPCPEDSVDWDKTKNLMIEGDNLEVLKLLQKSYFGKIKAIYIDPPYNTGRNVVYPNDYFDGVRKYLELTGQAENSNKLRSNTENDGRFHSNWLSMIYPRLLLAKMLLRKDGILCCTIDENESATLSLVLKEIFSEGHYEHANITIVHNPRGQQGKNISYVHETAVIVFPKDGKKYLSDVAKEEVDSRNLQDSGTESDRTDARNCFYPFIVSGELNLISIGDVPSDEFNPGAANVVKRDGSIEIWPITDSGQEKKWRYARKSVEHIVDKLEPKMGRNSIQIIFHKDTGTMRSVWRDAKYDSSEYGTKLVEALIDSTGFTFPKSLYAVYDCIRSMTENDPQALVLDFFAGSGTTAHAVWELNKDIGGERGVILVQLPEPLSQDNQDQRVAAKFCERLRRPPNIAEITKERLRRTSEKIRADNPEYRGDLGFRVFKLETSNIRVWDPNPDDLDDALLAGLDHIEPGRTEQDILYELLLKLGLDLCVPIETKTIADKSVYSVGAGTLFACLDEAVARDDVEPLAAGIADWHEALAPAKECTIVFRDSAFADDVAKTNLAETLKQRGLGNVRSL
ncbi:MAG: site-specific DNA-methyltransferase, partial [Rhodospirillaceae bacterium]|nr:site-specific DNA-methyltransferase [Rhodospirillaceae bacterium]